MGNIYPVFTGVGLGISPLATHAYDVLYYWKLGIGKVLMKGRVLHSWVDLY